MAVSHNLSKAKADSQEWLSYETGQALRSEAVGCMLTDSPEVKIEIPA